ncbi:MAG: phosphotransferase [Verrucomicrobiota bacterium]
MRYSLSPEFQSFILAKTGGVAFEVEERIQELWSGYGALLRISVDGGEGDSTKTVVVKHVRLPGPGAGSRQHPRGWNTDLSHARKVRSYAVEVAWYRDWSGRCGAGCRVPRLLGVAEEEGEVLLVMEDLDAAGYAGRLTPESVEGEHVAACLRWLANFHATFMRSDLGNCERRESGEKDFKRGGVEQDAGGVELRAGSEMCDVGWPEGLWETGTYWHLATRSEELAVLEGEDPELAAAAGAIDAALSAVTFRTLVHGDAKLANFCFSVAEASADDQNDDGGDSTQGVSGVGVRVGVRVGVAAVDFQYVGGGCGMKDVAYFLGSCLDESACEEQESAWLDVYFAELAKALGSMQSEIDAAVVEAEWRPLFPVAWTDFHRFLKGWSPGHWKVNAYSERLAREVVKQVSGKR